MEQLLITVSPKKSLEDTLSKGNLIHGKNSQELID